MTLIQTTGKKPVYSLVLVTYINTDGEMFSDTYFVVSHFFFYITRLSNQISS